MKGSGPYRFGRLRRARDHWSRPALRIAKSPLAGTVRLFQALCGPRTVKQRGLGIACPRPRRLGIALLGSHRLGSVHLGSRRVQPRFLNRIRKMSNFRPLALPRPSLPNPATGDWKPARQVCAPPRMFPPAPVTSLMSMRRYAMTIPRRPPRRPRVFAPPLPRPWRWLQPRRPCLRRCQPAASGRRSVRPRRRRRRPRPPSLAASFVAGGLRSTRQGLLYPALALVRMVPRQPCRLTWRRIAARQDFPSCWSLRPRFPEAPAAMTPASNSPDGRRPRLARFVMIRARTVARPALGARRLLPRAGHWYRGRRRCPVRQSGPAAGNRGCYALVRSCECGAGIIANVALPGCNAGTETAQVRPRAGRRSRIWRNLLGARLCPVRGPIRLNPAPARRRLAHRPLNLGRPWPDIAQMRARTGRSRRVRSDLLRQRSGPVEVARIAVVLGRRGIAGSQRFAAARRGRDQCTQKHAGPKQCAHRSVPRQSSRIDHTMPPPTT